MIPADPWLAAAVWSAAGFLCGSLPCSLWIGRWVLGKDIRAVGDGNPGAANVLRAGGRGWAVVAALLDALKAALPVALARWWADVAGWPLAAVAAAPVLGHAFSPWLGGRGGKAVAATFGVWAGLTWYLGPTAMGVGLWWWHRYLAVDGWSVMLAFVGVLAAVWIAWPEPDLPLAWLANAAVLAWTHRRELRRPPHWRSARP